MVRDPTTGQQVNVAAGQTFATKEEAEREGLAAVVDVDRRQWFDHRRGALPLDVYLAEWLARRQGTGRHGLLYAEEAARLARLHISPYLGAVKLSALTTGRVRLWLDQLTADRIAAAGRPGLIPAKAYRLLRAALADAVRDERIVRNPCDIQGAGVERTVERPLLEPIDLAALVEAAPPRRRAMVLLAAWCGLRFGELAALERRHVDLLHARVTVEQALAEVSGTLVVKAPKSAAGRRVVSIPPPLIPHLERHLAEFAEPGPSGFLFVGPKDGMLRRSNWSGEWRKIVERAGLEGVHFHDLRHAGATLAAQAGATERELQARLGHASPNAARRYQHAAQRRDQELAERLGAMIPEVQRASDARPVDLRSKRPS